MKNAKIIVKEVLNFIFDSTTQTKVKIKMLSRKITVHNYTSVKLPFTTNMSSFREDLSHTTYTRSRQLLVA